MPLAGLTRLRVTPGPMNAHQNDLSEPNVNQQ